MHAVSSGPWTTASRNTVLQIGRELIFKRRIKRARTPTVAISCTRSTGLMAKPLDVDVRSNKVIVLLGEDEDGRERKIVLERITDIRFRLAVEPFMVIQPAGPGQINFTAGHPV
jgi:hypothetical protein